MFRPRLHGLLNCPAHYFPQYNHPMKPVALITGDTIALAMVTLIGFASHGEFAAAYVPHMAASFIPLCVGWFLLAPSLGLFQDAFLRTAYGLWRPAFAMFFAGPFAALLRSIALGTAVMPSFAVVLTLTAALALTVWRAGWFLWKSEGSRLSHASQDHR